jgi:hypothetical protein
VAGTELKGRDAGHHLLDVLAGAGRDTALRILRPEVVRYPVGQGVDRGQGMSLTRGCYTHGGILGISGPKERK